MEILYKIAGVIFSLSVIAFSIVFMVVCLEGAIDEYKGMIRVRDSDESGRISLNLISENNRRVTIDNAIVITEEE